MNLILPTPMKSMPALRRLTLIFLVTVVVSACDALGLAPAGCTQEARLGISVQLIDAETLELVTRGPGVIVTTDGEFSDRVHLPEELPNDWIALVEERPGRYHLEIRVDGYARWVHPDVVVEDGGCHVKTTQFTVPLHPET